MSPKRFLDFKPVKTDSDEVWKLKKILTRKNLSVLGASKITGVGHKTFYNWLSGKTVNRVLFGKVIDRLEEYKDETAKNL